MLQIPSGVSPILRLIGIDPGSNKLGVATLDVDLTNFHIYVQDAQTFNAEKMLRVLPHDNFLIHGDRQARLIMLSDALLGFFRYWNPHLICSESPFMGLGVTAFETLVECVAMIRQTTFQFNEEIPLQMVSPTAAKRTVDVKAKGSDKEDVRAGVARIPNLSFNNGLTLDRLDEHSVDAIAVAYNRIVELYRI